MAGRQPRLSRRRRSRRRLSFHHERTSTLSLLLLLAQPDLSRYLRSTSSALWSTSATVGFMVDLCCLSGPRRDGPSLKAYSPGQRLAHFDMASASARCCPRQVCLAVACGQLLPSAVASVTMRCGQPWLHYWSNKESPARCLICARRPAARRAARTSLAAFRGREEGVIQPS